MEIKINEEIVARVTNTVSAQTRRMYLAIMKVYADMFDVQCLPIHVEQIPVIATIFLAEGISQQEIARLLRRDKSSVQRTIVQLIHKGLVKEERDPQDKRRSRLWVTATGATVTRQAIQIAFKAEEHIFKVFDAKEKQTLIDRLRKIADHLENTVYEQ